MVLIRGMKTKNLPVSVGNVLHRGSVPISNTDYQATLASDIGNEKDPVYTGPFLKTQTPGEHNNGKMAVERNSNRMEITKAERYANIIPMEELDTKEKKLNPFPIYNQLRQAAPVRFDKSRSCWDVFRYDDVHRILKDPTIFSSRRNIGAKEEELY